MPLMLEVDENKQGRDFAVGDIHGNLSLLVEKLDEVNFDTSKDRLFCLGDLIDRGNKNERVVSLIDNEVFFSILGNHEALLLAGFEDYTAKQLHAYNGGDWFYPLDQYSREGIRNKLKHLPFAIEIPIGNKRIGLVHAEVPANNWTLFKEILKDMHLQEVRFNGVNIESNNGTHNMLNTALWARKLLGNLARREFSINPKVMNNQEISAAFIKCYEQLTSGEQDYNLEDFDVIGIDHVYVGHNIVPIKCTFGDYSYIDTGSYLPNGDLTLVNLTETHS